MKVGDDSFARHAGSQFRASVALTLSSLLPLSSNVRADQVDVSPTSGYVKFVSNYIDRGLTQTNENPAVQGEIEFGGASGTYARLWGSNISWHDELYPSDNVTMQLDATAGYRWVITDDWSAGVGFVRAMFPGQYAPPPQGGPVSDCSQPFVQAGWRTVQIQFNYSMDDCGTVNSAGTWYLQASDKFAIGSDLSLELHVGRKRSHGINPVTHADHVNLLCYTDMKATLEYLVERRTYLGIVYSWSSADPVAYSIHGMRLGGRQVALYLLERF